MQSAYPACFEREITSTEREWLRSLRGGVGDAALALRDGGAVVQLPEGGRLELAWTELPPRRIALLALPRLHVRFAFHDVDDPRRTRFMRHFDLATQRGGG